jgi:hypothetical protein
MSTTPPRCTVPELPATLLTLAYYVLVNFVLTKNSRRRYHQDDYHRARLTAMEGQSCGGYSRPVCRPNPDPTSPLVRWDRRSRSCFLSAASPRGGWPHAGAALSRSARVRGGARRAQDSPGRTLILFAAFAFAHIGLVRTRASWIRAATHVEVERRGLVRVVLVVGMRGTQRYVGEEANRRRASSYLGGRSVREGRTSILPPLVLLACFLGHCRPRERRVRIAASLTERFEVATERSLGGLSRRIGSDGPNYFLLSEHPFVKRPGE